MQKRRYGCLSGFISCFFLAIIKTSCLKSVSVDTKLVGLYHDWIVIRQLLGRLVGQSLCNICTNWNMHCLISLFVFSLNCSIHQEPAFTTGLSPTPQLHNCCWSSRFKATWQGQVEEPTSDINTNLWQLMTSTIQCHQEELVTLWFQL